MSKEKFIVLDVEGLSYLKPYDIGFIIADRYGKIYKQYSFALVENMQVNVNESVNKDIAKNMTVRNFNNITLDINQDHWSKIYNTHFINIFNKIIEKHKIKKIFAYNVTFDKNALKRLYGEEDFEKVFNSIEFCDIWTAIINSKCMTKKYLNFCIENGFYTDKGNYKTGAEVVYRYLNNCLDFIEDHTGLNDVLIEYQILMQCFKTRKKLDFRVTRPFITLKNFAHEKGVYLPTEI